MSERTVIYMNRSKKGVTLIEVIVAIAVFAIISLALFSSVIAMKNVITRQEEYVKLEMVCQDIIFYGSEYDEYFVYDFEDYFDKENNKGYLNKKFKPTNINDASYIVDFTEDGVMSIYGKGNNITYVENVKLGEVTNE